MQKVNALIGVKKNAWTVLCVTVTVYQLEELI
jgi:hypothetical protein